MNRKIILGVWLLCSTQVFGMVRSNASAQVKAGSALFTTPLPWMSTASRKTNVPAYSGLSRMILGQGNASRFTMPQFSKWSLVTPGAFGGVTAYDYYNSRLRNEKLVEEQAKVAWLLNALQEQKQEARKAFDEIQDVFEQTPNEKTIPHVLDGYVRWISKLRREELNQEFRLAVGQYIVAKESMFDRKWNAIKYLYMSKKDIRMRDADKIEMDNEFTKMSQILDVVRSRDKAGTLIINDQFLRNYLETMKYDVLSDKLEQAWLFNALSKPAELVDKWWVKRND